MRNKTAVDKKMRRLNARSRGYNGKRQHKIVKLEVN